MYIFKFRRASSAQWLAVNPTLDAGEPGFEIDTGKLKIGNGASRWIELDYFVPSGDVANVAPDVVISQAMIDGSLPAHIDSVAPHPAYDEGPSLDLIYQNAKV